MKRTLLFRGPIKTLSGYGSHSRDVLKSLYDLDLFDIKIDSCNFNSNHCSQLRNTFIYDGKSLFVYNFTLIFIYIN